MKVVYCAHLSSPIENIGDVLSAQALQSTFGDNNTAICCLPNDVGASSNDAVIYGGGGMIRPAFYERAVFADFRLRSFEKPYTILGVGLNRDELASDFSLDDLGALREWIQSAKIVSVRDAHTKQFLQDQWGFSNIKLSPCPTYACLKKTPRSYARNNYRLGIIPSFGHTASYYHFLPQIVQLVEGLVESVGHKNVSIICHDKQDYLYARRLFLGKEVNICAPSSFRDVKTCYTQCDQIVSVRGHGIIFAAACSKRCSIVSLNLKMDTLYDFHFGTASLGLDFDPRNHLYFLKESRYPRSLLVSQATDCNGGSIA